MSSEASSLPPHRGVWRLLALLSAQILSSTTEAGRVDPKSWEGVYAYFCSYNHVRVDVWVMKDCEVKESWSKLFSVAPPPEVIRSFDSVTLVAYSRSGRGVLLVQDNRKLVCRDFIKSHLKRSTQTRNHLTLILWDYVDCIPSSVNFDSLDNAVELDHPFGSSFCPTAIAGSCDGLIGLRNYAEYSLAIWNPSTRRCQRLPFTKIDYPGYDIYFKNEMYGFGYDSVTDDYKMVRFVQFFQRVRRLPSDTAKFVAALDLTTEDYRVVPQPEFFDNAFDMDVAELGGCLCILCDYVQVRVDVWVMKDCGVKESWSKLFSVAQPEVIRSFDSLIPVAYSKSGCEVLLVQDNTKLVWYDLKHKTIKKIKTHSVMDGFESFVCVESLVPLNGRCVVLNEEGETYATD
ncbi:hypothetical protein RHMOL_Rhmol01G0120300 [Rhododendron molle]|uniref:Uncharacterized protein n=1 Tax=Rhododendron molle TaxID=49168 RepID=A0ACC0Q3H8_RHOML|nr:hypothetical protein RHMOL_Rhmol01G0120300 [Rhododendron molle]